MVRPLFSPGGDIGKLAVHGTVNDLAVVWAAYALALWVWHTPALYQAALRGPVVHDVEHLTFFAAALLFWRLVLDRLGYRRLDPVAAVAYLLTASLHGMALGVVMTLSPRPWYPEYEGRHGGRSDRRADSIESCQGRSGPLLPELVSLSHPYHPGLPLGRSGHIHHDTTRHHPTLVPEVFRRPYGNHTPLGWSAPGATEGSR